MHRSQETACSLADDDLREEAERKPRLRLSAVERKHLVRDEGELRIERTALDPMRVIGIHQLEALLAPLWQLLGEQHAGPTVPKIDDEVDRHGPALLGPRRELDLQRLGRRKMLCQRGDTELQLEFDLVAPSALIRCLQNAVDDRTH